MLTLRRGLRTVTSLSQSRTWQAAVCSRSLRFGGVRAALKTGQIRGFRTSVPCRDSKDETLKPKAFAEADQQFKDDIMSRTRLVTDEKECREITDGLIRDGGVIGVDCEGVQLPRLGLIQVRDVHRNIFLFRTGWNHRLLHEGGLKRLLENPSIIKVMHSATGDAQAVYNEGVKMWNLFDTAIAHKVIEYQSMGKSILTHTISFNGLCDMHGVATNPLKKYMKGSIWKREHALLDSETLDESFAFYSACDVEALIDLYEILNSLIDPDFQPLMADLCEDELLRAIDLELLQTKQRTRGRVLSADLFLWKLDPNVTKADIYETFSTQEGYKKVLLSESNRTAHVIMSNRASAILAMKAFSITRLPKVLGQDAKLDLVVQLKPGESEDVMYDHGKFIDRLKDDCSIVDNDLSAALVDILIKTGCPIAVHIHQKANRLTSLDVFVGKYPPLQFNITHDTAIKGRLGDLMASQSVPKVIVRIDANDVYTALKILSSLNFRAKNFFDVSTAIKLVDYVEYGQSIYKSKVPRIRDVMTQYGLPPTANLRLENLLYIYAHFQRTLPVELLEFLMTKGQIDLDFGGNVKFAEAKKSRDQLRDRMESFTVHVTCERGPATELQRKASEDRDDSSKIKEGAEKSLRSP